MAARVRSSISKHIFGLSTQRRFLCSGSNTKPFSEIPGPKGLPIVGSLFDLKRSLSKAGDEAYFHQLLLKYGPIAKVTVMGKALVVVGSPDAARKIFQAEGKYPVRSSSDENIRWIFRKNNYPTSMSFVEGEDWRHLRSSASKYVVPRRVANYAPGLCEIGDSFVEYLRLKRDSDGYVEDVNSALVKWAFQGIGFMVFDEKLDTFDESKMNLLEFQKTAIEYISSFGIIMSTPPLYKYTPTKEYRVFVKLLNEMVKQSSHILRNKYDKIVEAVNSGTVNETKAVSLMEQFLIEGRLTQKEALMMSCNMLTGGIDTSSNTATFLLHELAKQPELQNKLHHEVSSVLGDRNSPSFDDLQKMTLVRSCIKEILRLQPTAAAIGRIIDQDIELCGYHIPAKTQVIFSMYTASRDSTYVNNPTEFQPERWDKESAEDINAFISIPFGFGPRSCYGRRLAELELYILLAKISQNFTMSTKQHSLKLVTATLTKAAELVTIRFTDRK